MPYDEDITLASSDWREDPFQSAGRNELSEKVEAAINCLSPLHRDVIVLHELQGMTYQEVAAALDVPVGTVKSRCRTHFGGCAIYSADMCAKRVRQYERLQPRLGRA